MSTTIRISRRTKRELDKVLAALEREAERRLSYDEVIRILVSRSRILKRPELLAYFLAPEAGEEISEMVQSMLREERRRDLSVEQRRYGA